MTEINTLLLNYYMMMMMMMMMIIIIIIIILICYSLISYLSYLIKMHLDVMNSTGY